MSRLRSKQQPRPAQQSILRQPRLVGESSLALFALHRVRSSDSSTTLTSRSTEETPTSSVRTIGDVSTGWPRAVIKCTSASLLSNANPAKAPEMAKYMKFVAPFLGIQTVQRRQLLKQAWKDLEQPTSDELGAACIALMKEDEREFHYAVCDLIDKFIRCTDEYFLAEYVESLIMTKSWWDAVDGLGSVAVSPLAMRYDATRIIRDWSSSDNIWLIRAAIQHQRGWKRETNIPYVLSICHAHSDSDEFFVTKAIGWALRDLARLNSTAVRTFLKHHPGLSSVAVREARRGLNI